MANWSVVHGDCRDVMRSLEAESVDAIVSDPPYGLSFMGKEWDHGVPGVEFWTEALRVAKPGAHLVAFGGTRTYHRLAVAIEDAGWEVRDCLSWLYGSGFPKSKNLDGERKGWGTALKPAWEPIILARKPLTGTVAANVTQYGTGAINVDGCRIGTDVVVTRHTRSNGENRGHWAGNTSTGEVSLHAGRWPANVCLDEDAAAVLGEPSRFFYTAKVSRREREAGLDGMPERGKVFNGQSSIPSQYAEGSVEDKFTTAPSRNHHPTVKPIALMRWLCRLVTPPGGLILDPFNGSGSTGCAAVLEGFRYLGAELEAEYVEIAKRRIAYWETQRTEGDLFDA